MNMEGSLQLTIREELDREPLETMENTLPLQPVDTVVVVGDREEEIMSEDTCVGKNL